MERVKGLQFAPANDNRWASDAQALGTHIEPSLLPKRIGGEIPMLKAMLAEVRGDDS